MNTSGKTDWAALEAMTEEEIYRNALNDPDNPPDSPGIPLELRKEDGPTLLDRFNRAIERERNKVSLTVRYDADIIDWYKAKGKGYQSIMNAALRACMEAEKAAASKY